MKPVEAYRHVEPELDLLWHFMREVARKPEFQGVVDQLRIGPDSLKRVAEASLALYAGTMDFCALHALTGSHWLRILWPVLPDPDLALRYFWQAIAALYPKIGFPDLPSAGQLEEWRHTPTPDWPEIKAAAIACDDEHDISLTFSAFEEWKFYGDPLYQVRGGAARAADRLTETLLANALLPGGRRVDIRVADGKIAEIADAGSAKAPAGERIDLAGALAAAGPDRRSHPSRQDAARPALPAASAGRQRRRADQGREGVAAKRLAAGRGARHAARRAGRVAMERSRSARMSTSTTK